MESERCSTIRALDLDDLDAVSGGRDKDRERAVIEAHKVIESVELTLMDVESVPYVPMQL
jgi:hypothetical protein